MLAPLLEYECGDELRVRGESEMVELLEMER
jgi:hypothetical protein